MLADWYHEVLHTSLTAFSLFTFLTDVSAGAVSRSRGSIVPAQLSVTHDFVSLNVPLLLLASNYITADGRKENIQVLWFANPLNEYYPSKSVRSKATFTRGCLPINYPWDNIKC